MNFLNSEYNNAGELYGLDAVVRMVNSADPVKRAMILKKMLQPGGAPSRKSRAEMEKHFKQLPKHIQKELVDNRLKLADYTLYSIKQINSKTIKMFETQDDKEVGVSNVSNAKLPKNNVMLVSGIYLLTGTNPDPTNKEAFKAISFRSISGVPAICNGEFSLKANRKQLIPENQSLRVFATDNDNSVPLGYYKLDNPRLINDEELFEFTIELGTTFQIPPEQWLFVGLEGTITTP